MESKRILRPLCVILAVLYALNGVYIVAKRALVALIERFSEVSATAFIQGSSVAELVLFTLCTGICLLCAAFFTRGRLRSAFFVLTGAQAAVALGNLLSPRLQADAMLLSLCVMAASACCSIVGYALLAHAGHANELRAIGWLCAALVGTSQLCSALSIFSAIMLDIGTPALWLMLFVRTAQFTSVLSIVANIVQALCFILLLFAVQRAADGTRLASDGVQPASGETQPETLGNAASSAEKGMLETPSEVASVREDGAETPAESSEQTDAGKTSTPGDPADAVGPTAK